MSDEEAIKIQEAGQESVLSRFRAWIVLGLLYGVFFFWYTSFGGPLTDEEIAYYESVLLQNADGDEESFAHWSDFMRTDTGDDFAMLSAIDYKDVADPVPGLAPGATGREASGKYFAGNGGAPLRKATHPILGGTAASDTIDVWGIEGAAQWDQGVLIRYRSRRDLMNLITARIPEQAGEDQNSHDYKVAGMEKTIAYPLDPWFYLGDPRLVFGLAFLVIGLALEVRRLRRSFAA